MQAIQNMHTATPQASHEARTVQNAEVTMLHNVNTPPAQTWNYLKINGQDIEVPLASAAGYVPARLPHLFESVATGLGPEATNWIETRTPQARFIEIKRGTKVDEPYVIELNTLAGNTQDTGIMLRSFSEATVVIVAHDRKETGSAAGATNADATNAVSTHDNGTDTNINTPADFDAATPAASGAAAPAAQLVRIWVEREATLHVIEVIATQNNPHTLQGVGIHIEENAQVDYHQYAFGAYQNTLGLQVNLAEQKGSFELESRYLVGAGEFLDINHVVEQRGKHTTANLTTSGILQEKSSKTLRETINLMHGARGSKGNEIENVLLCGDDLVNKTLPVILCDEEDVQGNHGASIGTVPQEQLDYLADRGLSEEKARELFMRAYFDDALNRTAGLPTVQEALLARAGEVLHQDPAQLKEDSSC